MTKTYLILILLSFIFIPLAQSVTLPAGTIIWPNASNYVGYYNLTNSINITTLETNETTTFTNIYKNTTTDCSSFSIFCSNINICNYPAINTTQNLDFYSLALTTSWFYGNDFLTLFLGYPNCNISEYDFTNYYLTLPSSNNQFTRNYITYCSSEGQCKNSTMFNPSSSSVLFSFSDVQMDKNSLNNITMWISQNNPGGSGGGGSGSNSQTTTRQQTTKVTTTLISPTTTTIEDNTGIDVKMLTAIIGIIILVVCILALILKRRSQ